MRYRGRYRACWHWSILMKKPNYIDTYCEVDEQELDVRVEYDSSPPEPGVNWGGDFEIVGVFPFMAGKAVKTDMQGVMSDAELAWLAEHVQELLDGMNDPDVKADYLHDLRRDEG